MNSTLTRILHEPEWFPDAIYAERGCMDFCRVNRRLLQTSSFLDERMTAGREKCRAQFSYKELEIIARLDDRTDAAFIFHTSFCQSTLMAQALHVEGLSFSLKEPSVLLSLSESRRRSQILRPEKNAGMVLAATVRLATGLLQAGERPLIKPTNFANNLLPLVTGTETPVLLMYSSLESYLLSILKYGEAGRRFARQLFLRLRFDCEHFRGLPVADALQLTDLQIAAMSWTQQMGLFASMIDQARPGRIRTLDSETFTRERDNTLRQAFRFFDIPATGEQISGILNGPVFQQHSKSGQPVDPGDMARKKQELRDRHREELEETLEWAKSLTFAGAFTTPLPCSLGNIVEHEKVDTSSQLRQNPYGNGLTGRT